MKSTGKKPKKKSPLRTRATSRALWIGHFDSLEELEAFIDGGSFEKEQGFVIEYPLLPFNAFERDSDAVLTAFIRDAKQLARAKKALASLKLSNVNAAILHDGFAFDPKLAPRGKKRMTFLGSF